MRKIYLDMDGVLADFDGQPNALDRFIKEDGFFLKLQPTCLVAAINEMLKDSEQRKVIHILSASPNKRADIQKRLWLFEHLPLLEPENIIFVRGGTSERKSDYVEPDALLIDDFSDNLLDWESKGGKGLKLINGRNGKGIKWKGATLTLDVLLK